MGKKNKRAISFIKELKKQNINTWFDLGIYLDALKENRKTPHKKFTGSYREYKNYLGEGGMALVSFHFGVDGVSIEMQKYMQVFEHIFKGIDLHILAGSIDKEGLKTLGSHIKAKQIEAAKGFDDWKLYKQFFLTKLERGSDVYNQLIRDFWNETLELTEILSDYVSTYNIRMLFTLNTNSNPGNVSLALALVLVSEGLGIPVCNNNHDFYWEGGRSSFEKKKYHYPDGPRDFFFTNDHLGEVFSIIEMIYPWQSRIWLNVNINQRQSKHLLEVNGHNPANLAEIGTAVDTDEYRERSKRRKQSIFHHFEKILSRYEDTLIAYSAKDVLASGLVNESHPQPILIGYKKTKPKKNFLNENIIFLQPTRIIGRKQIEIGFTLIEKLFDESAFAKRFEETAHLKVTVLITGPIATGHFDYFVKLITKFEEFLGKLAPKYRNRVYLAFLFSELDKKVYKEKFPNHFRIPDMYSIASLVLLPSKTEGRGLPIIEATACGVPIFCSRYYPEHVYSEVIGEHLTEKERLKVIEFDGTHILKKHLKAITERVFFPHLFLVEAEHNQAVVDKRYSLKALEHDIQQICQQLYFQQHTNKGNKNKAAKVISNYRKKLESGRSNCDNLLVCDKREYIPGYGRLSFMLYLKSLIDPSYFRIEEMHVRGRIFGYAQDLLQKYNYYRPKYRNKVHAFYNTVESLLLVEEGELPIQHDHSLSYRHRNRKYYPYQDFTLQEISGLVSFIFHDFFRPSLRSKIKSIASFFTDWNLALSQLTSSSTLPIDDRELLIKKLQTNVPIALYPGEHIKNELDFFALQSIRSRLELDIDQEIDKELLKKVADYISPVYVIISPYAATDPYHKEQIIKYLHTSDEPELQLIYEFGLMKLVESTQYTTGVHLYDCGDKVMEVLKKVQKEKGFFITTRSESAVMTDILNIDRFHIGQSTTAVMSGMLGIPRDAGFIQFVPAGVRTCLAYPVPVQTARDFHDLRKTDAFAFLEKRHGKKRWKNKIRKDAEERMTPLSILMKDALPKKASEKEAHHENISGIYNDGLAWSGVRTILDIRKENNWQFMTRSSASPKTVLEFAREFQEEKGIAAPVAWNGGYILNAELVGKLGLPENYIGSPLGLLISDGKMLCPPLFNKPALQVNQQGIVDISRVNCSKGIIVSRGTQQIVFPAENYNAPSAVEGAAYYDLLFPGDKLPSNGKVFLRLAGNRIMEVVHPQENAISLIPVGLTLVVPEADFPAEWEKEGLELDIQVVGFESVVHAVEAGPLLLEQGEVSIDMESGGWKTAKSIQTQAARLDYTDMRGPKIAVGISDNDKLAVVAVHGRIRESVGATHHDMARILKSMGMTRAMGFDPGGSSSLVVNGKAVNISPYNSRYQENVYALSPEPRAVSNAVIGFRKSQQP